MPTPSEIYRRTLLEFRRRHARGVQATVPQLLESYANLITRITDEVATLGPLNQARARLLTESIRDQLATFGEQAEAVIRQASAASIELATQAHGEALERLAFQVGQGIDVSLARVPAETFEALVSRRAFAQQNIGITGFSGLFRTLVGAGLQDKASELDNLIFDAVGSATDTRRLTKEIAGFLAQDDPRLLETLRQLGPRAGRTRKAIAEGFKLTDPLYPKARSLLRKSELIAIHEMNSAYHEASIIAMQRDPVVEAVKWTLSGRHSGLRSSPDMCDDVANKDVYDLGKGVYPLNNIPSLLHPRCMCRAEPIVLPPSKWNDPDAKIMDGTPKPITTGHDIKNANRVIREATPPQQVVDTTMTSQRWTRPGTDVYDPKPGDWLPERQKLHDEIIEEFFRGYEPQPEEVEAIFAMMGGGPAAGKGSLLRTNQIRIRGKILQLSDEAGQHRRSLSHNLISIDSDEIKRLIPEYDQLAPSIRAALVHEESSYLSKRILERAVKEHYDVFFDGTGDGNLAKITKKVNEYRRLGHRIEAHYVTIDTREALFRNWSRFLNTGRLPPPEMVRNVHQTISEWMPQALDDGLFDVINIWDTAIRGNPRLIHNGKEVLDQDLWNRFLAKAIPDEALTPELTGARVRKKFVGLAARESRARQTLQDLYDDLDGRIGEWNEKAWRHETRMRDMQYEWAHLDPALNPDVIVDRARIPWGKAPKDVQERFRGIVHEFGVINKRRSEVIERKNILLSRMDSITHVVNRTAHQYLYTAERGTMPLVDPRDFANYRPKDWAKKVGASARERAGEAQDFIERLLGGRKIGPVAIRDIVEDRANYTAARSTANMGINDRVGVYVHEFGHHLEYQVQKFHDAVVAFLRKRVGSEKLDTLDRKLFDRKDVRVWSPDALGPKQFYETSEWGWNDKFFNTYMGKTYMEARRPGIARTISSRTSNQLNRGLRISDAIDIEATEILSFGVQLLYEDPVGFARKDPEYFDFIVDLLRGHSLTRHLGV